jgi:hypothetical protein|tara:strand:- start:1035 stop:1844 length:810 start_codon:yes stop_codon:yes gene_type:complete
MRSFLLLIIPFIGFSQLSFTTIKLDENLQETSGLEWYGDNFITHNDSGDKAKLYVFTPKGVLIKSIRFHEIKNKDWEDIAADEHNYYIADTGNNLANRKNLKIHILSKDLNIEGEIRIHYSSQKDFTKRVLNSFDAEALTVLGDSLALFSKNRLTQKTELYIFPKKEGDYVLSPSASLEVASLITAADYNQKHDLLALTGYNFKGEQFFYTATNFIKNGWDAIVLKKYFIPIEKAQIEAVKIKDTSKFWLTSEGEINGFARLIELKVPK